MLHQDNAHFAGTDPVFKRAANVQTASQVQLYGCTGFRNQNRKPQTKRNTKKIGKKSTCQLSHHMTDLTFHYFSLSTYPINRKYSLKRGKTTLKSTQFYSVKRGGSIFLYFIQLYLNQPGFKLVINDNVISITLKAVFIIIHYRLGKKKRK